MQTKEVKDRDREIENTVGNLMIAQYQVQKIRSKLSGKIGGYYHLHNTRTSAFAFKDDNNEKWYKVSIRVDEMDSDKHSTYLEEGRKKRIMFYNHLSYPYYLYFIKPNVF